MTVKELLNKIDSYELTEWQAFERLEPFGQMPLRMQLAHFMSLFYNAIPGKRKTLSPKQFVVGDMDYLTGEEPKQFKQSGSLMKRLLMGMVGKK